MIGKRRALVVDYGVFGGGEHFAFDQFGPRSNLPSIDRAADSSRQPVATSWTIPEPSRYLAV